MTRIIQEFKENLRKQNVEVLHFTAITEAMLKRFFNKNQGKIEDVLIILKQGEQQNEKCN